MNTTTRILLIILGLLIIGGIVYALVRPAPQDPEPSSALGPTTFEECAAQNPVMESFPRRCVTPEGLMFTEEVPGLGEPVTGPPTPTPGINYGPNANLIQVTSPSAGADINSPVTITGQARGTWYFEASFPVEIRNSANVVIATHYAQALTDWMTEDFVAFSSTVTYPAQPAGSTGTIILRNDNPSGLPENAKSISIPVTF